MLAGIIAIQAIAIPGRLGRFVGLRNDDFDIDDYDSTFTGWTLDSLWVLGDSLLRFDANDSIPEDSLILLDVTDDSLAVQVDSFVHMAYIADSTQRAKIAWQKHFDSLSRKEQRIWMLENVILPAKLAKADSILAIKDSIKAYKDSVIEATPRILETRFLPDSLRYKRILLMTQDKKFGDITIHKLDTSYNYNFYDYPFMRKDVGANWQGVAGTAVQYYNYALREEEENALFFTPYRVWTYTPSTLPMYNTKTAHTELAYWGTLLAGDEKEEINLRLLTTQNITPGSNITFELNKYGGGGVLAKSNTAGYNMALSGNYLGKRYAMHAGWIHTRLTHIENGGIQKNKMILDTLVDSKEIAVNLAQAENDILNNTFFVNQSFRIPFGSDSLTTAFIGHSLDASYYSKTYSDAISDDPGRTFYFNRFLLNSVNSNDTMRVWRIDNKLYLRLQPWKDDAIVSKIDVGIGDKYLSYYDFNKDTTSTYSSKTKQNNIYAYAGARGMVSRYFNWDANAQFFFAGYQAGDFNVDANATFNFYPFRKARKSPVSVGAHFHNDLTSADHYRQRLLLNHVKWDNNFGKQNTMRISGSIDIPHWNLDAQVAYTLRNNAFYFDTLGISAQSGKPVSVLSASLRKEFVLWKFHLDNRILFQTSSDQLVAPVPMLALNLRYYFQFNVVKDVMQMQIGANALFTTKWNVPRFDPNSGIFYNQNVREYGGCPYIDAFVNIQWKRACIFIKVENVNQGWPLERTDYFCSDGYIHTQRGVKFGIFWPFYVRPGHSHQHSHDDHGASSGMDGVKSNGGTALNSVKTK